MLLKIISKTYTLYFLTHFMILQNKLLTLIPSIDTIYTIVVAKMHIVATLFQEIIVAKLSCELSVLL